MCSAYTCSWGRPTNEFAGLCNECCRLKCQYWIWSNQCSFHNHQVNIRWPMGLEKQAFMKWIKVIALFKLMPNIRPLTSKPFHKHMVCCISRTLVQQPPTVLLPYWRIDLCTYYLDTLYIYILFFYLHTYRQSVFNNLNLKNDVTLISVFRLPHLISFLNYWK
jgi:hypothetical protein